MVKECIMDVFTHSDTKKHKPPNTLVLVQKLLCAIPIAAPPSSFELAAGLRESLVKLRKVFSVTSYIGSAGEEATDTSVPEHSSRQSFLIFTFEIFLVR
jgi:hypothetical protein